MEFTTRLELHSQTTRLVERASGGVGHRPRTGLSPSTASCSKALGPATRPRSTLSKLQLGPWEGPDFKFELLPLHSPLLRQSRLVSCPPLIDMLKFSGYPYPIRGQPCASRRGVRWRAPGPQSHGEGLQSRQGVSQDRHFSSGPSPGWGGEAQHQARGSRGSMTLERACPPECRGAQCAFKDSMIH